MGILGDGVSVMVAVGIGVSVKGICVANSGVAVTTITAGDGWMISVGWISNACAVMVATKSGALVGACPPPTLHARIVTKASIENRNLFDLAILHSLKIEIGFNLKQYEGRKSDSVK
jgi:hypothetical protein